MQCLVRRLVAQNPMWVTAALQERPESEPLKTSNTRSRVARARTHPLVSMAVRSVAPARKVQVSAERQREATRIIAPSTDVVGGTDHHR